MAKKNFYAVKKGKKTGIFRSWAECRSLIEGYPGAEYKGFVIEAEAQDYLGIQSGKKEFAEAQCEDENFDGLIAYVDGSFDESVGKYAFGCVLITPSGNLIREFGNGDNPESLALRNVTGEMLGAMYAVQWGYHNGYTSVDIRYDYEGIRMWATGGWRAKNDRTQKYRDYMQKMQGMMTITFTKIAAHTGNQYNEEADQLAKRGLIEGNGIPPVRKEEEYSECIKDNKSD